MMDSASTDGLFLGIDLSTQQLKAVVVDDNGLVVATHGVHFATQLPGYRTEDGAIRNGQEVNSPVHMWLAAMDMLMDHLATVVPMDRIRAVSGTAQQHGTVYWAADGEAHLRALEDGKFEDGLQEAFARRLSPIWMDSSTSEYVQLFDSRIPDLADVSGSKAYHRFSGPQISKIFHRERDVYEKTARISLVSSFVASLFLGRIAPIDLTDACGTNLLDIRAQDWSDRCLEVAVGAKEVAGLRQRLAAPVSTATVIGTVSRHLQHRFGMHPACKVIAFTGDNMSSMADLNVRGGDVVVSLGTSDTLLYVHEGWVPPPSLGHLFIHPTAQGQYITLVCYKNGSLTRERIRKTFGLSWEDMEKMLTKTPPGNNGQIGLFFDLDEIEPRVKAGDYRWNAKGEPVAQAFDDAAEVRALLEGQCMHLRVHSPDHATRIILTGGASANRSIQQLMADVFGIPVYTAPIADSAALGGAKRARYGHHQPSVPYSSYTEGHITLSATPSENVHVYKQLLEQYKALEKSLTASSA